MQNLDDDLILKFKQGDEAAFGEIYKQMNQRIYTFCKYLVPAEDAEDITAELFYRLWKTRQDWTNIANVNAYLLISARNSCYNLMQSKKIRSEKIKTIADLISREQMMMINAHIESDLIGRIAEEVQKLPDTCQKVFTLSFFDGYDNLEIAEMLDINGQTVRNLKSIALKTIKTAIFGKSMQISFFAMLISKLHKALF